MNLEKLLYGKREAANLLNLSEHTVARDIRLGRIQSRHYGRRVLIPRDELMRIASEGMQPTVPALEAR
jgi:excisionase family DNA binding protein